MQQLSLETTSSMNTSGVITSSSSKSIVPRNVISLLPERTPEVANDGNAATVATAAAAAAIGAISSNVTAAATGSNSRVNPPNSWWRYFGMNKNKKTSIESL
ncbi:uncharacterized protein Dwil_GK19927 [Drosophila willistoni]|uniref:Uncharacterized protein n=2 Tax=Drosophila willistoni TaxID=7260 RepID=B4MSC8_DROWI|nr:uncharacterized protein Dwil_GK19927 [Drosophila willistoni]